MATPKQAPVVETPHHEPDFVDVRINRQRHPEAWRTAMQVIRREGRDHVCRFSQSTYRALKAAGSLPV